VRHRRALVAEHRSGEAAERRRDLCLPVGIDELNLLGAPHGIEFFDDWIVDLKSAYGLRVIGE